MRVHVAFTPAEAASSPVGIVVDVLRATSTIAQALATGYERVYCSGEIDEALALKETLGDAILGGERNAVRIDGFDVGASPREFLGEPRTRDGHLLDHERDAGDPGDRGALRPRRAREPAQPRRRGRRRT